MIVPSFKQDDEDVEELVYFSGAQNHNQPVSAFGHPQPRMDTQRVGIICKWLMYQEKSRNRFGFRFAS